MFFPKVLTTTLLSLSLTVSTAAFGATIDDTVYQAPIEESQLSEAHRAPYKYTNLIEMLFPIMKPQAEPKPEPQPEPAVPEIITYADGHFEDPENPPFTVNGILFVNKTHPLSETYRPFPDVGDGPSIYLLPEAQAAYDAMLKDATVQGFSFYICSGYRSFAYQNTLFQSYAASVGEAQAATFSAKSGQSEHQTGLAMDVCSPANPESILQPSFEYTPAGKWLADNSWRYGFILRYPKGKEAVTGYQFEPWHFRYVGTAAAAEIGPNPTTTLEEYFGIVPDDEQNRILAAPNQAIILVNDKPVTMVSYNINNFTYYRLRDLAVVLNNTGSNFDIQWDAENSRIDLKPNTLYKETHGLATNAKRGNRTADRSTDALQITGQITPVDAYKIDGSNFYKLRDLAIHLGFKVEWNDNLKLIQIQTEPAKPKPEPTPPPNTDLPTNPPDQDIPTATPIEPTQEPAPPATESTQPI